ncbi:Krueppel-like factor 1, partial [Orchesella cincta]
KESVVATLKDALGVSRGDTIYKGITGTHTGEKPYLCWWPGCTSNLAKSENRKGHYDTHTKQQPPGKVVKASTVQVKVRRKWMPGRGNHNEIQKAQQSFDEVV